MSVISLKHIALICILSLIDLPIDEVRAEPTNFCSPRQLLRNYFAIDNGVDGNEVKIPNLPEAAKKALASTNQSMNMKWYGSGGLSDLKHELDLKDEHVLTLMDLGAKKFYRDGKLFLTLPSAENFIAKYNHRIDQLVHEGVLKEEETLRPALVYTTPKVRKVKTVLIGRENSFPPKNYQPSMRGIEMSHELWSQSMAQGESFFSTSDGHARLCAFN